MSDTGAQPDWVFFADRNLGKQLPLTLSRLGWHIERHDDHFDQNTQDPEWLTQVGRHGWIVLTHDKTIRRTRDERDAAMRAGVRMFVLIGSDPLSVLGQNLVNTAAKVFSFLQQHPEPFIARIYKPSPPEMISEGRPGRVEPWFLWADWVAERSRR